MTMMQTPDEETERLTVTLSALEEVHREREQPSPSPSSSARQKRKDPRPASKDDAVAPTSEVKQGYVNWGKDKDENQAKLQESHNAFVCNIDPTMVRTGKWTADEDSKLKGAVKTHGGKDWPTIALLVPCRTRTQSYGRWKVILDLNSDTVSGRTGKWTVDEISQLEAAVQAHKGQNWMSNEKSVLPQME